MSGGESKAEKFVRLRDARLPKVLESIRILSNLSSPNYEYTESQVEELLQQLQGALNELALAFGVSASKEDVRPTERGGGTPGASAPSSTDEDDEVWHPIMSDVRWALEVLDRDPSMARDLLKRAVQRHWALHGKD